jgi:beta-glucuronidase
MSSKSFILGILIAVSSLTAQSQLLINLQSRETNSLNGNWKIIVDPYENGFYNYRYIPFESLDNPGKSAFFTNSKPSHKSELLEYDFDKAEELQVPGDWNTQMEKLFYYEGTVWYKKSFEYYKSADENRVFLYFGAVNYQADVYFNGKKLGRHLGGFTPFNFEVTDLLKEKENFVVVKVDNKRKKEAVPTLNTDWWNYGGITRSVELVETPETFIQDYFIQLDPENPNIIKGYVRFQGNEAADRNFSVKIPELNIAIKLKTDAYGFATMNIPVKDLVFWSPDSPKLYDVILSDDTKELKDKIGFRTIKTRGQDILLNGDPVFLRGISVHEERPISGGRVYNKEDAQKLLQWAKELGCNFVRLAHYPHNEYMVRLADEMGILVWEENPVYWTIEWDNNNTYNIAQQQLNEVIQRDKNRASVIIWSMSNETPNNEARMIFLKKLADFTRKTDPTRLISAALEQSSLNGNSSVRTIHDPFADIVDVLSFNQYIGWYDGLPEKCETVTWEIKQNKPVIISEFGGGAKFDYHGDKNTRWTEEFQEYLYEENLKMLSKLPQLRGMSPWILMDFRSPRRVLPEIQDNWNRKGLLSEKGEKKKAYFVLQGYYLEKSKNK